MLKGCVFLVFAALSGCAVYYPPTPVPAGPDPAQAQAAADAQCAKSGKVAVMIKPADCNSANCTTTFACR
jgi:hypothetical protein